MGWIKYGEGAIQPRISRTIHGIASNVLPGSGQPRGNICDAGDARLELIRPAKYQLIQARFNTYQIPGTRAFLNESA